MKKQIFLIVFFLIIGLISIGCQNVSNVSKKGKIVIRYWDSMPPVDLVGKVLHQQLDEYSKEHPEVIIKREYLQWEHMNERIMTSIVAGDPPDVVLLDRFVTASYAARNALTPLDEFIQKSGIKRSDYWDACWDECIYNGHMWSMPHHTDLRILYYNVEHFQEVGLDPNKPPRTWQELYEYAKKLTKKDKNGRLIRIGFLPNVAEGRWLYLWGWANGGVFMKGNKITCNDPKIVEALEWMVKINNLAGRRAVESAVSSFGERVNDPFVIGKLSMKIDGDWNLGFLKQYGPNVKFKIAPVPVPKGHKPVTWSGGFAFVIPRGSKHVKEAWNIIKYLTSYKKQLEYAKKAYRIPALKKAAYNKEFLSNKYYKILVSQMRYSKHRPVTPVAQFYWDELRNAVEVALLGKKTPKEALDEAAKKTQEYLNEYLKNSNKYGGKK